MNQTRIGSLIETLMNTFIGFLASFFAWPMAAYIFSIEYGHGQHVGMVAFFTVISVLRGYVVRRWFNARLHRMALNISRSVSKWN